MSVYEEEIFNYLTKKDNFFSAYEIYQTFPTVKNSLIEEFWKAVKSSLEDISKEKDWQIEISDNIFETYSSLNIYVSSSNELSVSYEKLHSQTYFGLWIDNEDKSLERAKINEYASRIEQLDGMRKSNYWLGWSSTGSNFDNIETLKKILPNNKNEFAHEMATQLFEFASELEGDIKVLSKMKKMKS